MELITRPLFPTRRRAHDPRITLSRKPALTRKCDLSTLLHFLHLYLTLTSPITCVLQLIRTPISTSPHAHTPSPQPISRHQIPHLPSISAIHICNIDHPPRRTQRRESLPSPSERELSCHPAPVAVPLVTATLQLGPDKRFDASITPST